MRLGQTCLHGTSPSNLAVPCSPWPRWCKQLPVTFSVVVFISPNHRGASAICYCGDNTPWSRAALWVLCAFASFPLCTLSTVANWAEFQFTAKNPPKTQKFTDGTIIACATLRVICNLCWGLNEATQNAESLCQVESLDGNFPAAFSGAFLLSVGFREFTPTPQPSGTSGNAICFLAIRCH